MTNLPPAVINDPSLMNLTELNSSPLNNITVPISNSSPKTSTKGITVTSIEQNNTIFNNSVYCTDSGNGDINNHTDDTFLSFEAELNNNMEYYEYIIENINNESEKERILSHQLWPRVIIAVNECMRANLPLIIACNPQNRDDIMNWFEQEQVQLQRDYTGKYFIGQDKQLDEFLVNFIYIQQFMRIELERFSQIASEFCQRYVVNLHRSMVSPTSPIPPPSLSPTSLLSSPPHTTSIINNDTETYMPYSLSMMTGAENYSISSLLRDTSASKLKISSALDKGVLKKNKMIEFSALARDNTPIKTMLMKLMAKEKKSHITSYLKKASCVSSF